MTSTVHLIINFPLIFLVSVLENGEELKNKKGTRKRYQKRDFQERVVYENFDFFSNQMIDLTKGLTDSNAFLVRRFFVGG